LSERRSREQATEDRSELQAASEVRAFCLFAVVVVSKFVSEVRAVW